MIVLRQALMLTLTVSTSVLEHVYVCSQSVHTTPHSDDNLWYTKFDVLKGDEAIVILSSHEGLGFRNGFSLEQPEFCVHF
jgi:hypothetical protein